MATLVLIQAINNSGSLSEPVKIYLTEGHRKDLPEEFVLTLKEGKDRDGREVVTLGNYSLKLVGTHLREFITKKLKGFRRKTESGKVVILCQMVEDEVFEPEDVHKLDVF